MACQQPCFDSNLCCLIKHLGPKQAGVGPYEGVNCTGSARFTQLNQGIFWQVPGPCKNLVKNTAIARIP